MARRIPASFQDAAFFRRHHQTLRIWLISNVAPRRADAEFHSTRGRGGNTVMLVKNPFPKPNQDELILAVQEFVATLDALYGYYLDCTIGFDANCHNMDRLRNKVQEQFGNSKDFDSQPFSIGSGSPNDPQHHVKHRILISEFKKRNSKSGDNYVRAAQHLITIIHSFWEHEYRPKISSSLGLSDPNELKIPLLGDVRLLRRDIIHHKAITNEDTSNKLCVLKRFDSGQQIIFCEQQVEELIMKIKSEMDALVVNAVKFDPKHRTIWRMG